MTPQCRIEKTIRGDHTHVHLVAGVVGALVAHSGHHGGGEGEGLVVTVEVVRGVRRGRVVASRVVGVVGVVAEVGVVSEVSVVCVGEVSEVREVCSVVEDQGS